MSAPVAPAGGRLPPRQEPMLAGVLLGKAKAFSL